MSRNRVPEADGSSHRVHFPMSTLTRTSKDLVLRLSRMGSILLCALFAVALAVPAFAAGSVIDSLHCNDSTGVSLMKGRTVTLSGVVIGQFSSARNARLYLDY